MNNAIPDKKEKSRGALIAFAVGDALGWPNERSSVVSSYKKNYISNFKKWSKRSGGKYWSHSEIILPGEYSDDTQLMLSVSRSLLSGSDWAEYFTKHELPFWKHYERGGGSAVLRAAEQWSKGRKPWEDRNARAYYCAGGNGAAMRILPHVIKNFLSGDFKIIYREIVKDSMLTHGHPRAILGALCYAYAAYYLLSKTNTLTYSELIFAVSDSIGLWGEIPQDMGPDWFSGCEKYYDYQSEWRNVRENIVQNLKIAGEALSKGVLEIEHDTLNALGCFDRKINGAGDIAAVTAIYFVSKYANNPVLAIKQAANSFGSDTDTLAAMTGGLAGSLCGLEWIPYEWRAVQDYKCLDLIGECLVSDNGFEELRSMIAQSQNDEFVRTEIGKAKEIDSFTINSGKTGQICIRKYITVLGQTIYIKEYKRLKNTVAEHSVISITADRLEELLKTEDLSNITMKELIYLRKMKLDGADIAAMAEKLSIESDIVAKLLDIIIF